MNPLTETVFLAEIVLQSKIAKKAADRLPKSPSGFDHIEVWCSIQSILVSAGNVSKILWPNNSAKARGEQLRKLLNIDAKNILANRKFRNHFEHYDERIEKWFKVSKSSVYDDLAFNPIKPLWKSLPENHNRAYDQVNRIVTFRGETLDLNEILNALKEIQTRCRPYVFS